MTARPGLSPPLAGHLAMLIFSASVAGSFALGGQVADEISPLALNALRFVLAAALLGAVLGLRDGLTRAALRAPWRYLIMGGLLAAYFVAMFEGLQRAAPVSLSAVFTLTPLISGLFGYLLLRQVMDARIALALGIGAIGAGWVIFDADLAAALRFDLGPGEVIFFVGCVAHALYTPVVRLLNRGEGALSFSFLTLTACSAVLLVWGAGDILATDWAGLRPFVWFSILYIAVGASALSVVLVQFATLRLPASKVMAYTYLVPSWVIVWELGLGLPAPAAPILIGIAITVFALFLLLREAPARPPETPRTHPD